MKVRFTAEIIDDNGNTLKTPVSVETKVPDLTDFNCPSKFLKVFVGNNKRLFGRSSFFKRQEMQAITLK